MTDTIPQTKQIWISYFCVRCLHRNLLFRSSYRVPEGQYQLQPGVQSWRHQAITWTNADLSSVRSIGIYLGAIWQDIARPSVTETSLKVTYLKFCSNIQGANELIHPFMANYRGRYFIGTIGKIIRCKMSREFYFSLLEHSTFFDLSLFIKAMYL